MAGESVENQTLSPAARARGIIRTSLVGIGGNVLLAAFKAVFGLLSNSIAIVLDAVNNLSDALSSIITIVGTKLAAKAPDRDHPYGHGRTEYITTIIIGAIVVWAGIASLREALGRIIEPQAASYDTATLVVVAVAVVAKIVLGRYFKVRGRALQADSLVASGTDATMDAVISASTLIAAGIYLIWGISLEAWLGAIISLVIVKAGVDILREAISRILGERVDADLATGIKRTVRNMPGVRGCYDLILNDYGPDQLTGSLHVEVDESTTAREIDTLSREIQRTVYREHGVILHTVGIYSLNEQDTDAVVSIRRELLDLANIERHVLEVHGFYVDEEAKTVNFDLVVGWDAPDRRALYDRLVTAMAQKFPDYTFVATLDSDITD